jgi:hypothetical protein
MEKTEKTTDKPEKKLLWTEHINKVIKQKTWWQKYERL